MQGKVQLLNLISLVFPPLGMEVKEVSEDAHGNKGSEADPKKEHKNLTTVKLRKK